MKSSKGPSVAYMSRPDSADEEQPLLGGNPAPRSSKWRKDLMENVHRDYTDIVLLLCYIITGLLDSTAIWTWGCFVSMQTGNTVYIGLGLANLSESSHLIKSLLALASFCVGSFFFSRFHRYFTVARRWVLCVSFLAQMIFIVIAATILTFTPEPAHDLSWNVLVPIALIAFQACGQAVTSRALKLNALTSVVLTSIYCDLFSDAELFAWENIERNRRVAAPLLLFGGAVAGGMIARTVIGPAGVLWIAAGLKFCVVITWFLWRGEEE